VDLDFDADQDELRDSIRAVLVKEAPLTVARRVIETDEPAAALWDTMVELGWPALTVPEADGGIGLGAIEAAILAEELGRVIAPGPLLTTVTQFVPVVRALGDDAQRSRFLNAVADGRTRATLAIAEASGSFDPRHTTATAKRDGDALVLEGTKRFVMSLLDVDEIACTVRLDGAVRVVVVPSDAVELRRLHSIDDSRPVGDVVLDGVRVDADRLLAGSDEAALADALLEATLAVAMEIVGACQTIFDITLDYAKQREQFGVPIGSFQAIKHKFADLYVALERARSLGYYAALCLAEHDGRATAAVAAAKAAAGDAQHHFGKDGIQLLGGIGYTWEHDMQMLIKRVKANEPLFGTAIVSRARLADLLNV
jgi:alkylation response protein AidB-like acyl-CoA dehydrogenase